MEAVDSSRWSLDGNGIFWVHLTYVALYDYTYVISKEPIWKKIWNINIPPKVNIFIWRLMRDRLPSRENLKGRNVVIEGYITCCLFCKVKLQIWSP